MNADVKPVLATSPAASARDCAKAAQALNAGQKPGDSAKLYEKLTQAAKSFVFTVIVREGQARCTVYYPGVFQVTGYTMEEYASQPLLWFSMVHADDKEIVLQQAAKLLKGETPPPVKHRITRKDGSACWLRNTSVPVFDLQGKLVAYDGLVADISEAEFAEKEHERQIAELTSALAMVKTLHSLLPICCSCKSIRDDEGYWQQIEEYLEGRYSGIMFTHGLCPGCAKKLYPEFCEGVTETPVAPAPLIA